jgi:hypothetical protein
MPQTRDSGFDFATYARNPIEQHSPSWPDLYSGHRRLGAFKAWITATSASDAALRTAMARHDDLLGCRLVAESATTVGVKRVESNARAISLKARGRLLPEKAPAGGAKTLRRAPAPKLFSNILNINDNFRLSQRHSNSEVGFTCVFFTQHIAEIVRLDL